MYTLAIDPSIKHTGVALFRGDELQWARTLTSPDGPRIAKEIRWKTMADLVKGALGPAIPGDLVIEFPEIYKRGKARPNDIMLLAGLAGYLAGAIESSKIITYLPKQWKRQVPPEICIRRIKAKLTPAELTIITEPESCDNSWDAIGIGLFRLRRFGK